MDPNSALDDMREAIKAFTKASERAADDHNLGSAYAALAIGEDLTESAEALDEWITQGGFLPTAWRDIADKCALDAVAVVLSGSRTMETLDAIAEIVSRAGRATS